jgi:hypothetical protein
MSSKSYRTEILSEHMLPIASEVHPRKDKTKKKVHVVVGTAGAHLSW